MLKRIWYKKFWFFSVLFSLFVGVSFATTPAATITLEKYYRASCAQYIGSWEGFMVDPSDLFGNGGPWPVKVALYNKDQYIIGQTGPVLSFPVKKIWGECHEGVLSNIFWGNKGQCGALSQKGLLVSENSLVLELSYENAMNGTHFLVFLKRIGTAYPFTKPTEQQDFILGQVQTCH